MSVFKTKGIILKIEKIGEKDFLYTIFTHDYGKIKANKKYSKTEKSLDIGYIINFEIHTKENMSIHKIKNIKISSEFNINKDKDFSQINNYMIILSRLFKEYPNGLPNNDIFNIIEKINNKNDITSTQLILSKLKLDSIMGILDINHKNETIGRILKYISNSNMDNIFKLIGITDELKKELELI